MSFEELSYNELNKKYYSAHNQLYDVLKNHDFSLNVIDDGVAKHKTYDGISEIKYTNEFTKIIKINKIKDNHYSFDIPYEQYKWIGSIKSNLKNIFKIQLFSGEQLLETMLYTEGLQDLLINCFDFKENELLFVVLKNKIPSTDNLKVFIQTLYNELDSDFVEIVYYTAKLREACGIDSNQLCGEFAPYNSYNFKVLQFQSHGLLNGYKCDQKPEYIKLLFNHLINCIVLEVEFSEEHEKLELIFDEKYSIELELSYNYKNYYVYNFDPINFTRPNSVYIKQKHGIKQIMGISPFVMTKTDQYLQYFFPY